MLQSACMIPSLKAQILIDEDFYKTLYRYKTEFGIQNSSPMIPGVAFCSFIQFQITF